MPLAALLLACAALQETEVVLHPRAILDAQGRLIEDRWVTLRDGRIRGISAAPRSGALELDGVLAPGFVDAFTSGGAAGRISEEAVTLAPGLRAADGADLDLEIWRERARRGITAAHLVPEPTNVLAGSGALFATQGAPRLVAGATLQVVSLLDWTYDERVGPTALAGCLELLDGALADPPPALRGVGLLIFVENAEGLRAARELCERARIRKRHFALLGDVGTYGGEAAQELVCLPAGGGGAAGLARQAEVLRRLHGVGARVAFGTLSGADDPEALRQSAMLFARAVGDPQAAWAALTTHPAEALGLDGEIGAIAEGARADLVLWSAHPLDAAARVLAVTIGGQTLPAAAPLER